MRAHQVPGQIFREMEQMLRGETSALIGDGCRFEFMQLPCYETMLMHGGRHTHLGNFSFLHVWRFLPKKLARKKDLQLRLKNDPDFQVVGGPFPDMIYSAESGRELLESVRIFFGFELYRGGIAPEDPFLMFITWLPRFVSKIVRKCRPAKLRYWQASPDPHFHERQTYDAMPKGKLKLECGPT